MKEPKVLKAWMIQNDFDSGFGGDEELPIYQEDWTERFGRDSHPAQEVVILSKRDYDQLLTIAKNAVDGDVK